MKTAIITSNTSLNHNTGLGHPERPERVTAVIDNLKKNKKLIWKKAKKFDHNLLNITHSLNYVNQVKNLKFKKIFHSIHSLYFAYQHR